MWHCTWPIWNRENISLESPKGWLLLGQSGKPKGWLWRGSSGMHIVCRSLLWLQKCIQHEWSPSTSVEYKGVKCQNFDAKAKVTATYNRSLPRECKAGTSAGLHLALCFGRWSPRVRSYKVWMGKGPIIKDPPANINASQCWACTCRGFTTHKVWVLNQQSMFHWTLWLYSSPFKLHFLLQMPRGRAMSKWAYKIHE